ncbi:hypothetical protein [Shewanella sp. NKUCC06_TVS]|uniref:hypothetical protein n=1 Tax=Shewanella sp. NKUCC06_TVS TaxID=2842128 RepID=UPI001C5AC922|nr:hypothetical protein [Shewanella sp. NKUCC06_TVS]MBW3531490.1 hypothetical protein [Shewanella sp. NKUCC06_TVS]
MPETGQFDQQPEQSLLVEVITVRQQGGQFFAAPPHQLVLQNRSLLLSMSDLFYCFELLSLLRVLTT